MPGRRQAAFVPVEHVQPGEHVAVKRLHAHPQLAVVAEGEPVPAVEFLLIGLRHVIQDDEHALRGVFDDGGERPVPAHVLAAERQAPALQPAGSALRRMRAAGQHLRWIHVAAVGGVQFHVGQAYGVQTEGARSPGSNAGENWLL